MEETIKNLEIENQELKNKLQHIKDNKKNYFQNVQKLKTHYCPCCDKYIKYNSIWFHYKSKKHINKLNEISDINITIKFIDKNDTYDSIDFSENLNIE